MKLTWMGQAGLYVQTEKLRILIDPYFSNSVERLEGKKRRVPVPEWVWDITPDVMIFTHDHLDHYDPETAERYLKKDCAMLVLCPESVRKKALMLGGRHHYVRFCPGVEWTEGDVRFVSVPAVHSDIEAVGVIMEAEGKKVYVTGDTLYSKHILRELPGDIDLICLPVNGAGNNMNMLDAARFAAASGAKQVMPLHVGMFDQLDAGCMEGENKVIPEVYKTLEI